MNTSNQNADGIVKISDEVIAVCAVNATLKTKGVANLSGGFSNALSKNILGKELMSKGVKVSQSEEGVEIDVHITVKYLSLIHILTIPQGSGASSIVDILDENGLVRSRAMAKIHARIGGYDTLQANTYIFSRQMTVPEMLSAINTGNFKYVMKNELVVREGLTIPEVAEAMAEKFSFSKQDILDKWNDRAYLKGLISDYWFISDKILDKDIMYPLEGYLYPETYFITEEDPTVESVTKVMLDKMDEELTARKADIDKSGFSVHEILSLASIVEREASNSKEDMPKVAGVFINRLDKGMNLGSDVTVCLSLIHI